MIVLAKRLPVLNGSQRQVTVLQQGVGVAGDRKSTTWFASIKDHRNRCNSVKFSTIYEMPHGFLVFVKHFMN